MSTLLEPETNQVSDSDSLSNSVNQVRGDFAACRVKFRWFGTTKTLSTAQKSQAAESFGAQGKAISAAKRLIDTKNDRYRVLTSIKSNIVRYWKDSSLAFPEPGIRLIRQDRIDAFDLQLARYQQELQTAVGSLDEHFNELKEAARVRLGSLFNLSDYPASLAEEFAVVWDFPNVEAPEYLRRLNPEAEQAFIDELDQLVAHLAERLSGDDDGKPKIFRDTSLTNLTAFFRRFHDLNVSSNDQLDDLVERCQQLVSGVAPQSLRDNDSLRTSLSNNLSSVQSALDQLMVERPRRNIIRPSRQSRSEG